MKTETIPSGTCLLLTAKTLDALEKAVRDNAQADTFTFRGFEFVPGYAKYLCEYARGCLPHNVVKVVKP